MHLCVLYIRYDHVCKWVFGAEGGCVCTRAAATLPSLFYMTAYILGKSRLYPPCPDYTPVVFFINKFVFKCPEFFIYIIIYVFWTPSDYISLVRIIFPCVFHNQGTSGGLEKHLRVGGSFKLWGVNNLA